MRLFFAAAALSLLVGCVHPKPKPPAPQPTPTPEATMPGPGVPVAPEMLLRQDGGRLTGGVQLFGAVQCCMAFKPGGVETNSRWPMASEEWQDFTHAYGANAWHARIAPFLADAEHESEWADVGAMYKPGGLEWNPAFWNKARELVWRAYKLGGWVEVNVSDTWYAKVCQSGQQPCLWPADEIDAWGRRPSPEQERAARKVVSEFGCFGNTYWLLDNEGGNVRGTNAAWYLWLRDVIRDEERKSGCNFVHLIGTNSGIEAVELAVDYTVLHDRAPLTAPKWEGHWAENNERNPSASPEEEASRFKGARDAGQAYFYWRAEQSDEEMVRTLGLFRDVALGAQTGCFAPEPDDPKWTWVDGQAQAPQAVAWLNEAKAKVGDPKLMPGATVWDRALEAMRRLGVELRNAGHCASGPWKDAVVIQSGSVWTETHPVALTDGGYTAQPYKGNSWRYQQ